MADFQEHACIYASVSHAFTAFSSLTGLYGGADLRFHLVLSRTQAKAAKPRMLGPYV